MNMLQEAQENLDKLKNNRYVGRGFIVGLTESGELVQVYWIMGRSENSRNRIFTEGADGLLFTEVADPSKVKDPSLIIYNAMCEVRHGGITYAVVSNGSQTDDVAEGYAEDRRMEESLQRYSYEPDAPNFTPRITAACYWRNGGTPITRMSLIRKSSDSPLCDRLFFDYSVSHGFGRCLTTYMGDGDPLPAFKGEPRIIPLPGDAEMIKNMFWVALDCDNRVSLAVKTISKTGQSRIVIINQYSKV